MFGLPPNFAANAQTILHREEYWWKSGQPTHDGHDGHDDHVDHGIHKDYKAHDDQDQTPPPKPKQFL